MKQFDWEYAKSITKNPTKLNWLWLNHNQKITEEDFMVSMQGFRSLSSAKKKYKSYSIRNLKYKYRKLKENFGFFK